MLVGTEHVGCPVGLSVGMWMSVDQFIITGILVVLSDPVAGAIQVAVRLILAAQSL